MVVQGKMQKHILLTFNPSFGSITLKYGRNQWMILQQKMLFDSVEKISSTHKTKMLSSRKSFQVGGSKVFAKFWVAGTRGLYKIWEEWQESLKFVYFEFKKNFKPYPFYPLPHFPPVCI